MNRKTIFMAILLTLAIPLTPAFATTLPPGGSINGPTPLGSNPITALHFLTSVGGNWSFPSPPDPTPGSGTYTESVYTDSNGFLVFAFQVKNAGPDIVETLTSARWSSGVTIDAEQWVGGQGGWLSGTTGGKASTISRHSGVIRWSLNPYIGSNRNTYVLLLYTNAKKFVPGSFTIQDGGTATVAGLVPAPEPATLSLLGIGLFGLLVLRRTQTRHG